MKKNVSSNRFGLTGIAKTRDTRSVVIARNSLILAFETHVVLGSSVEAARGSKGQVFLPFFNRDFTRDGKFGDLSNMGRRQGGS